MPRSYVRRLLLKRQQDVLHARIGREILLYRRVLERLHQFLDVVTVGSDYVDTVNVQNLVKAFKDPRVQTFIANDPEVKKLALPGQPA